MTLTYSPVDLSVPFIRSQHWQSGRRRRLVEHCRRTFIIIVIIIIIIIIITNKKIAVTLHKKLQGHFTQSNMRSQKTKHLLNDD